MNRIISKIKEIAFDPVAYFVSFFSNKFKLEVHQPNLQLDLSGVVIRVADEKNSDINNDDRIIDISGVKVRILNKFDIRNMKGFTNEISGIVIEIVDEVKIEKKMKRKESMLNIDETKQEKITSIGTSSIEMVKIAMATLLSIFVPQYCPETGTTCTLEDNFINLTNFNILVIAWNFITLFYFIKLLIISNRRESYFIKTLDESHDEPYNSLVENMHLYPLVLRRVEELNYEFRRTVYSTTFLFGINILFSCILVFNYYYDGFRTATTLIANVLLVSQKLYSYHELIKECCKPRQMALSAIFNKPISYNVIDDKFMLPADFKRYIAKKRAKQMKKLKKSAVFLAPNERKY
jgi:hypothetical protein